MSLFPIYLDIETIPVQQEDAKAEIRQKFLEAALAEVAAHERDILGFRPPSNLKDPAKIAAWEETERPKKVAEKQAMIAACQEAVEAKFDAEWRKTSFDGALGQIVAIAWALGSETPAVLHVGSDYASLAQEAKVIRGFFDRIRALPMNKQAILQVVGHWVSEFDLRFIFQRAVIHGIPVPALPFHAPAWSDKIFDTMQMWAGNRGRISLDKLCKVLGIAGKGVELGGDDIDGSKVWDFVRDGRILDVATYCVGDVERVREIHRRMTFVEGA